MSDAESEDDRLAEIRQQKRERLREKLDEESESVGTPDEPIHVGSPTEFQQVVGDHEVVLVDFFAEWCGPCKQLEPIVERLAAETDAAVATVDVDRHQQIAGQYQVRSMPTLLVFADGEPAERVVGARGYDQLAGLVGQYT